MKRSPAERTLPWAALASACAAVIALDQGSGGVPVFRDTMYYFMPQFEACRSAIANGEVPLWNPYIFCGHPLLATLQVALFSPLTLPFLLFPYPEAVRIFWLLAMLTAAAGMFACGRRAGMSPPAACVAAVLYAGCGPMRTLSEWPNIVASVAFLPSLLAVLADLLRGRRGAGAAVALLAALQLLSGQPRQVLVTAVAAAIWTAAFRPAGLKWRDAALRCVLPAAAALLLAAIQLLPSIELFLASERQRQGVPPSTVAESFLRLRDLLTALLPRIWGDEHVHYGTGRVLVPRLYLGWAGIWLAARALGSPRRPAITFGVVAIPVGMLLALGEPLFKALTSLLAEAQPIRYMGHLVMVSVLGGCILAGAGADRLLRKGKTGGKAALLTAAVLALAVLAGAGMLPDLLNWSYMEGRAAAVLRIRIDAAVAAVVLAGAWALLRGRKALALLPILLAADLTRAFHGYILTAERSFLTPPAHLFRHRLREGRMFAPTYTGTVFPNNPSMNTLERYRARFAVMSPNLPQIFMVRNAHGYEPFRLDAAAELYRGWEADKEPAGPALRATGVRWSILPVSASEPGWVKRERVIPDWYLWELPNPRPLASVMPATARSCGWRELDDLPETGAATLVREDWNGSLLKASASRPSLLVIRSTWRPGWRARVNGARAPLFRAGGIFQGVPIPGGRSEIRCDYAPLPFAVGSLVGSAAAGGLLAAGLLGLISPTGGRLVARGRRGRRK